MTVKYWLMNLSLELRNYLISEGATEAGFADITDFTPKKGLNTGVIFYITYPKEIIRNMQNAPTQEYVEELVSINARLDALGMKCEEFLINKGYLAYAQTKKRLGTDFGEFNSFELPHKTVATRAGLGWIGKSALFTTKDYGSALRMSSVLLDDWKTYIKIKMRKMYNLQGSLSWRCNKRKGMELYTQEKRLLRR